jgi:outer membrane lipoprotein SlyB
MKDNNSGLYPENKLVTQQPKLENTLKEGVIVGISKVVTTHDSSNDRAVNGALLGGAASYFLSRRPSITKTLIGASTGAVVGKTTGGDITQTTNYILTIKNLSDNSITQKATTSSGFMVKDTINYDEYSDVIFKKS